METYQKEMVEELDKGNHDFDEWEEKFISCLVEFDDFYTLSPHQNKKLSELYNKFEEQ